MLYIMQQVHKRLKENLKYWKEQHWFVRFDQKFVELRTLFGKIIQVPVWYWARKGEKPKQKYEYVNMTMKHLNCVRWCTPWLASDIVSTGLYAPSFQVAENILAERWVLVDDNKIASVTYKLANIWMENRWENSFMADESFEGKNILIGVDWGRINTRKKNAEEKRRAKKGSDIQANGGK